MRRHTRRFLAVTLLLGSVGCGGDGSSGASGVETDTQVGVGTDGNAALDLGVSETGESDLVITPTPELCDVAAPLAALPSSIDLWWWAGEPEPQHTVSLVEAPAGCSFALDVSHPWIEAELIGATVKITLDPSQTTPGMHAGQVRVIGTQASNATIIPVVARLWSEPMDGATPMALVIGIDGVRPDALTAAQTPYLDILARGGATSLAARTQLKGNTKSGPGWASVVTGVDTDKHGVTSNDLGVMDSMDTTYPSFVQRAEELLGITTAAIVNWVPVALLIPEALLEVYEVGNDLQVGAKASDSLRDHDHRLTFVHLDEVDGTGHGSGFSVANPAYLDAIEASDLYVGQMLTAILDRPTFVVEDWLIVVTTDHGGLGYDHGPMDADNQTIWFMAAGPRIPQQVLGPEVNHMDVHPTVLAHLGAWPSEAWNLDGQVVGVPAPD